MGYKSAYIKLANCYLLGIGTKKDRRSAFYWFSEAKSAGDASACYPLGLCYAMGIGVALDYKKAAENLLLAKENGSENAALALTKLALAKKKKAAHTLYSKGMRLLYQKKYVAAKESFESAYKNGHAKSAYALGAIFEFGLSTQTDRSAASALYAEAYKLGFSDTGTHLKRRILKLIK